MIFDGIGARCQIGSNSPKFVDVVSEKIGEKTGSTLFVTTINVSERPVVLLINGVSSHSNLGGLT